MVQCQRKGRLQSGTVPSERCSLGKTGAARSLLNCFGVHSIQCPSQGGRVLTANRTCHTQERQGVSDWGRVLLRAPYLFLPPVTSLHQLPQPAPMGPAFLSPPPGWLPL